MRHIATLLALLALATPGSLEAQPADSVALRFAWPVGMSARVEQEWTRIQESPAKRDSTYVRSAYRLQVLAHPSGRLIQVDSFAVLPSGGRAAPSAPGGDELLAQLGSLIPSYVVSPEGEFVGVADIDRLKSAFDSLLAPVRKGIDTLPPQARALMENVTSREALTAAAAQEWNVVAGTWVGADWEVGSLYGYSAEEPIAYLPGQKVKMNYEFAALERVPCVEGEKEVRCVHLSMRSEPDSAAFANLLRDFFTQIAPEQRGLAEALRNMRAMNELTVIAEPSTLRPHWVELVKSVEVNVAPAPGEAGGTTTRVDRRAARYSYAR